jgi:hypothetical protein
VIAGFTQSELSPGGKEKAKEESPEARVVDDVRVLQTHHFGMPWLRRQEDHERRARTVKLRYILRAVGHGRGRSSWA